MLLLPLFFRVLLFTLKDIGPRAIIELSEIIEQGFLDTKNIVLVETSEGTKACGTIPIKLKPEFSDLDLDYVLYNYYYPALFIEGHIKTKIDPLVNIIGKSTVILYYVFTILGFSYILLNN